MTREQSSYLKQRLSSVRDKKPASGYRFRDDLPFPKPQAVVDAEKAMAIAQRTVRAWEKKRKKKADAVKKAVAASYDVCLRLILMGDFKSALNAIDKFETKKFY